MDKTNVDNMLIEMISPKVKEIEEKFSRGEGLSNEDINTLLLKSQYNHINHLDQKLEGRFNKLEGRFEVMEANMRAFQKEIKLDISEAINKNMKWSMGVIALIVTVLKLADMFIQ